MISLGTDRLSMLAAAEADRDRFATNGPFPHIVIDNFFDPAALTEVLEEFSAVDQSKRYAKFLDRKTDHNKFAFYPDVVGPKSSRIVDFLNSGLFVRYLETLTGIDGLLADPSYFGGGLHKIRSGGFLEVHADFNHHKRYNLERRLNLLLYLNKDWASSYNGNLELWDRQSMQRRVSIEPIFNRCVIFPTTRESLHGHPVPLATPTGKDRMSIALYYYTNTWQPSAREHSTLFYVSQDNHVRLRLDRIVKSVLKDLTPPIFAKSIKAIRRWRRGDKFIEV